MSPGLASPGTTPRTAGGQTAASGSGIPATGDAFRTTESAPVQKMRPMEPVSRPTGTAPADRSARRPEVLARATGGALEAFDPGAERVEEPIEPSTAIKDDAGALLTPHLDAWMRVLEAGGAEPPSPRGVAAELCGLAEADALQYSAVLHRTVGAPMGALLRALGKIELKSVLRNLGPEAREGLIGSWASGFRKRPNPREMAAEVAAVTHANPRSFGTLLEKAGAETLRTLLGSLRPAERDELFALLPRKVLDEARRQLGGLVPAMKQEAAQPGRAAPAAAVPTLQLAGQASALGRWLEALEHGTAPVPGSAEAVQLRAELGRELIGGGVKVWKQLGAELETLKTKGFRGAEEAALLLSASLEGLRTAARTAPAGEGAGALQIPFSLAGRFDGLPKAVFTALGRHCGDDLSTVAGSTGLWRALVGDVLRSLRTELGDSEAARAWQRETGA